MEEEKKRLIIIDGNAVVHRAFHALPPLTTKKGQLVNAVYGFLLVFLKTLKEFQPEFVVATFDFPAPTFRHKEFEYYKAQRPKTPDELSQQIPIIKEILKSFNVTIFEKEGYEADDIIGTIVEKVKSTSLTIRKGPGQTSVKSIIITGDLDTLQLVKGEEITVYTLKKGIKDTVLYDASQVKERYGIEPEQLLDFKALRGDPSDNIPGVPGIGEKTALSLIKEHGSLEKTYQAIDNGLVKEKLGAKLQDYKEQAFLSKKLAQIKKDVPVDFDLEKCRWQDYNKEKASQILKNYDFYSLIPRLP